MDKIAGDAKNNELCAAVWTTERKSSTGQMKNKLYIWVDAVEYVMVEM